MNASTSVKFDMRRFFKTAVRMAMILALLGQTYAPAAAFAELAECATEHGPPSADAAMKNHSESDPEDSAHHPSGNDSCCHQSFSLLTAALPGAPVLGLLQLRLSIIRPAPAVRAAPIHFIEVPPG